MEIYRTKTKKLSGMHWTDVYKKAFGYYKQIRKKTKRRPYVRSAYFKKDKIFLDLYWRHLHEKRNLRDKTRRVKYFNCAIELIQYSHLKPISKKNYSKQSEILHRFAGTTPDKELFFVQIKEDKYTGQKYLISAFPVNKQIKK